MFFQIEARQKLQSIIPPSSEAIKENHKTETISVSLKGFFSVIELRIVTWTYQSFH